MSRLLKGGLNPSPDLPLLHSGIDQCVSQEFQPLARYLVDTIWNDYPELRPTCIFASRFGMIIHFNTGRGPDSDIKVVFSGSAAVSIHTNSPYVEARESVIRVNEMPISEALCWLLNYLTAPDLI